MAKSVLRSRPNPVKKTVEETDFVCRTARYHAFRIYINSPPSSRHLWEEAGAAVARWWDVVDGGLRFTVNIISAERSMSSAELCMVLYILKNENPKIIGRRRGCRCATCTRRVSLGWSLSTVKRKEELDLCGEGGRIDQDTSL